MIALIRIIALVALCCVPLLARADSPNNFLAGIRSIDVTMHRVRPHKTRTSWFLVAYFHHGGGAWYDKEDALSFRDRTSCERMAGKFQGEGEGPSCFSRKDFCALKSTLGGGGQRRDVCGAS